MDQIETSLLSPFIPFRVKKTPSGVLGMNARA